MEEIMRVLSVEIGTRFGGTDGEHRAANYLRSSFEAENLETDLQSPEKPVTETAAFGRVQPCQSCWSAPGVRAGASFLSGLGWRGVSRS